MPDKTTVLRWLANEGNTQFRAQYAHARDMQADAFFDEAMEIANDASGDQTTTQDGKEVFSHEHVQRSKLRVDTLKWAAGKLAPKRYGDRTIIDTPTPAEPEKSKDEDNIWAAQLRLVPSDKSA